MSGEVLIPKMKRLDKSTRRVKIPILNFAIVLAAVLMIICSTFVNLEVRHFIIPSNLFSGKVRYSDFVYCFYLIPQIPVVMFVCSVLGRRMALTAVLLYIFIGLFFAPVFALGGGLKYIFQYGFGYILAFVPAVVISGKLLNKYSFFDMLKAVLAGVFTIHLIGILYMMVIALIKHSGFLFVGDWIGAQSGLKVLYDLVLSYVLVLMGKYLHKGLKFILE